MTEPSTVEPSRARWSLGKRLLFRFALLYFVMYALPFPFRDLWTLFNGLLREFEVDTAGWAWMIEVQQFFYGGGDGAPGGLYEHWWQSMTSWLGERSWVDLEVVHQSTGSGDTVHALLKIVLSAFFALGLTLVWSLIARRRAHHRKLGKVLHLGARWYLGFTLLVYGIVKLYSGQFAYPSLHRLMTPLGDTSPMGLVWTFMGLSKPYEVFSGVGECVGGLLLLWRRTSLLGCFVSIAVLTNIVALNWLYDVPVKLFSAHLLLFAVALTLPDVGRLWRLFVTNRPVPPADLALTRFRWINGVLGVLAAAWVGYHLYSAHVGHSAAMQEHAVERPALYGVWEVETLLRDGEPVPPTDAGRWKWLIIDVRESGRIRTVGDQLLALDFVEDVTAKTVSFGARGNVAARETWAFERGHKTVPGENPAPRTWDDARRPVDRERESLILRGRWEGERIEVHLLRKEFRLERGFHLLQELPFNR